MSNFKQLDNSTDWSGSFSNRPNSYYRIKSDGGIPTTEFFDRSVDFVKIGNAAWYYQKYSDRIILGLSFVYSDGTKTLEMVDNKDNTVLKFTAVKICSNKVKKIQVNAFETGPSSSADPAFVSFGTLYRH